MRLPLVRRTRLEAALADRDTDRSRRAERDALAREHERDRRRRDTDAADALIGSVIEDYYRAAAAQEDFDPADQIRTRQGGIMDQCVVLLCRLTGKDSVTVSWALQDGTDPRGYAAGHGLTGRDAAHDRFQDRTEPYRRRNAGVYSHLAPEVGGPRNAADRARQAERDFGKANR